MAGQLDHYRSQFDKLIETPGTLNNGLTLLEEKTKVKKTYIAYGIVGLLTLWLAFGYGAQLLCNFIAFLYPAYVSIKALESGTKADDTQWLMYWVVFALFSVVEFFSDILVGWVPFYWLLKCLFLIWCMSPMKGASLIYTKLIQPYFLKHEAKLDSLIKKGTDGISKFTDSAVETAKDYAAEQQLRKDD